MADKKGLPTITNKWGVSRRDFGKGVLKGVTGAVVDTAIGTGLQALPSIIKSATSSSETIKATIPLLTEYFNIKSKILNLPDTIWGKKVLTEDEKREMSNAQKYYDSLLWHSNEVDLLKNKLDIINEEMKDQGISFDDHDEWDEEHLDIIEQEEETQLALDDVMSEYDDLINIISTGKSLNGSRILNKKSRDYINKVREYKNDQNTIRLIADEKKVPFNYFSKFIANDLISFNTRIQTDQRLPKEHIKDSINTIVSDDKNYGRIQRYNKDLKRMEELSTPTGLQESIERDYQFYKNTPEGGIKGWKNSTQNMTPQEAEAWQKQEIKKSLLGTLKNYKHMLQSNQNTRSMGSGILPSGDRHSNWDTDLDWHSDSLYYYDRVPPSERKKILQNIKEDLTSVAKTVGTDVAKDYVKEKFITKENKPGPWTKKLADYAKSFKTPKAPSGPTIESDKIRAEQAKEIKEVKQKVTPKRNLVQDLKGVGKRLKYSPLGAALYATEVGDAELPLETSPRGYGVRKENRGRSSRDYYKTYNAQRLI